MITTLFGRKKLTEDKLANIFVNAVLELTDQGYPMIVAELQESPEFERMPAFGPGDDELFAQVVLAGNLIEAKRILPAGTDRRMFSLSISKFAQAFGLNASDLEVDVIAMQHEMERLNFPSKNTIYAMSKMVFAKFDLFRDQKEYFRDQRAPDPIVLKRLNGLMGYFLWNWAEVNEEYRIVN
jgi:hypothetical protein